METIIKEHERLATIEQDLKSIHRRIDNLERLTESVHTIATELKETRKEVCSLTSKVDEVEKLPARKAEKLWATVCSAIITAIVGFVFGLILGK